MQYPVTLARDDNETILVSFPDFPEAHSYGDDAADALAHAQDALATVIDAYIKDKREVPRPSTRVARHHVTVPALIEAKLALYEAMRSAGVGKAELARRLDCHLPQIDRLPGDDPWLAVRAARSRVSGARPAARGRGRAAPAGAEPSRPTGTPRRRVRTRATA